MALFKLIMIEGRYLNGFLSGQYQMANSRDGFGQALVDLGEKDERVVVLSADLSESTRANLFAQKFPDRYFEIGVAEQNLAGVAAGLALEGKIPFMTSFGVFSPGYNWGQIRVSICYSNVNVKIVSSHGGIAVGGDGATHQALEDIALMRVLPKMTVVSVCDYLQAYQASLAVAKHHGPVYLRLTRQESPIMTSQSTPFDIGRAIEVKGGQEAVIIVHGPILFEAIKAAKIAQENQLNIGVFNFHTIKPLDEKVLDDIAEHYRAVVVAEDHQQAGGLFGAVCEYYSQTQKRPAVVPVGVADTFGESARSSDELMKKYRLKAEDIYEAIKKSIGLTNAG